MVQKLAVMITWIHMYSFPLLLLVLSWMFLLCFPIFHKDRIMHLSTYFLIDMAVIIEWSLSVFSTLHPFLKKKRYLFFFFFVKERFDMFQTFHILFSM